jgi:hypothetical protein
MYNDCYYKKIINITQQTQKMASHKGTNSYFQGEVLVPYIINEEDAVRMDLPKGTTHRVVCPNKNCCYMTWCGSELPDVCGDDRFGCGNSFWGDKPAKNSSTNPSITVSWRMGPIKRLNKDIKIAILCTSSTCKKISGHYSFPKYCGECGISCYGEK